MDTVRSDKMFDYCAIKFNDQYDYKYVETYNKIKEALMCDLNSVFVDELYRAKYADIEYYYGVTQRTFDYEKENNGPNAEFYTKYENAAHERVMNLISGKFVPAFLTNDEEGHNYECTSRELYTEIYSLSHELCHYWLTNNKGITLYPHVFELCLHPNYDPKLISSDFIDNFDEEAITAREKIDTALKYNHNITFYGSGAQSIYVHKLLKYTLQEICNKQENMPDNIRHFYSGIIKIQLDNPVGIDTNLARDITLLLTQLKDAPDAKMLYDLVVEMKLDVFSRNAALDLVIGLDFATELLHPKSKVWVQVPILVTQALKDNNDKTGLSSNNYYYLTVSQENMRKIKPELYKNIFKECI